MRWVDARLSTDEVIKITEEWFVRLIDVGWPWMEAAPVEADFGGGMVARVNPKFIVWARLMEKKE